MKTVFINCVSEDSSRASELHKGLELAGFSPWLPDQDIAPGENREHAIRSAIDRSDFIIVCLSRRAVTKRGDFRKRIRIAIDLWQERLEDDIFLIPLRLEPCKVPAEIAELEPLDLFEQSGMQKLLKALHVGSGEDELDGDSPSMTTDGTTDLPLRDTASAATAETADEKRRRLLTCMRRRTHARLFVEIKSTAGKYSAKLAWDKSRRHCLLDGLRIGPEAPVTTSDGVQSLENVLDATFKRGPDLPASTFGGGLQYTVGVHLYRELFGGLKPSEVQPTNGLLDIRVVTDDMYAARLPWRLLAHHGVFLAHAGWSLSLSTGSAALVDCELPPVPRILMIAPQVDAFLRTDASGHAEVVRQLVCSIDAAYKNHSAFRAVGTWPELSAAFREFRPNIVYYYGVSAGQDHRPAILLNAGGGSSVEERLVTDLVSLLRDQSNDPPVLVYVNCCRGDHGVLTCVGQRLESIVPAVIIGCPIGGPVSTQNQGLDILRRILRQGVDPSTALTQAGSSVRQEGQDVSVEQLDVPALHCHYSSWAASPPAADAGNRRDPHWQLKLDRVSQFSQVFFETYQMLQEGRPRALAYLWYGKPTQGVDLFHRRLKIELQQKIDDAQLIEALPAWPADLADPHTSFVDMFCQAFEVSSLDQITARIRAQSRASPSHQCLVYARHAPISSLYTFHPDDLRTYLEWFDLTFLPLLPKNTYALLGISYEVSRPIPFRSLLMKHARLDSVVLSSTVFQVLDELDRVAKQDLLRFIQTHDIPIPGDIRDDVLEYIMVQSDGDYEMVLQELADLERTVWQIRQQIRRKERENEHGEDQWKQVF